MPIRAFAEVPARAALAGNPSDGYGGRTLAVTLEEWRARVEIEPAGRTTIGSSGTLDDALASGGGDALAAAAAKRLEHLGLLPDEPFALRWETTIPREVGLAGSSALVIATLRALCSALEPHALALAAWEAETVELGIAAGPQDRVVQAHGGLVSMDFDPAHGPIGRAESLDRALLPPLFVAWQSEPGETSGAYHSDLRGRHESIGATMDEIAGHARSATEALRSRDHGAFAVAMDASFDARCRLGPGDSLSRAMVERARELGCAANQAGSGGAVVGVLTEGVTEAELRSRFASLGCEVRVMLAPRQG